MTKDIEIIRLRDAIEYMGLHPVEDFTFGTSVKMDQHIGGSFVAVACDLVKCYEMCLAWAIRRAEQLN